MMRLVALSTVLLLLSASGARAEFDSKPKVFVHGDIAIPTTPQQFSSGFSLGLGGGVGAAFSVSPRLAIVADIDQTVFGIDDGGFSQVFGLPTDASVSGDQIAVLYASLAIKFDVVSSSTRMVKPYLIGGFGFFRYNPDDFAVNGTALGFEDQNTLGVHAGGGFEIILAPYLGLFADVLYVLGFTGGDATGYVPIRAGIAFDLKAGE
jgi:hypothetical protein